MLYPCDTHCFASIKLPNFSALPTYLFFLINNLVFVCFLLVSIKIDCCLSPLDHPIVHWHANYPFVGGVPFLIYCMQSFLLISLLAFHIMPIVSFIASYLVSNLSCFQSKTEAKKTKMPKKTDIC